MTLPFFFISGLIILDIGAALAYLATGDLRRAIYWLAAATLTVCVTL